MGVSLLTQQKLYGLFEMNEEGTVLYSRVEPEGEPEEAGECMVGRNFIAEVVPFGNVEEFRHRVGCFTRSQSQADSFNFNCEYGDGPEPVRVLLARIRERSGDGRTKSLLVHIRKI
jgi:hypothetical protein